MLTREVIEQLIASHGYALSFHKKYCPSAYASRSLVLRVYAVARGQRIYIGSLYLLARMNHDQARQLIATKLAAKVEARP